MLTEPLASSSADSHMLDAAAPARSTAPRRPGSPRRVLVDVKRQVVGYRLPGGGTGGSLRGSASSAAAAPADSEADELPQLAKPTFMHIACAELRQGELERLKPEGAVLEIRDAAEVGAPGHEEDLAVLRRARQLGFKLAFDTRLLQKAYAPFVPLASYVLLEMGVLELDRAATIARSIRSHSKIVPFATQVRTSNQFDDLSKAGVQMFEGLWFTKAPAKPDPKVKMSYGALVKLLNLVMREAEISEIEELLRREPTIAFKLLRHINSCGFGMKGEITSFRHAVMTVGQKGMFRWAALLVAHTPSDSIAPAAGTLAVVRGRLMELLVAESYSQAEADLAFVTGMFSMLDVLLGMRLEDALALVDLPAEVTQAILGGRGVFAPYLEIARACEAVDDQLLAILSERCRMSLDHLVATHLQAIRWSEQFGD